MDSVFVEADCKIVHEGREFESGGAWICDCSDGYRRGVVYAKPAEPSHVGEFCRIRPIEYPRRGIVTDWHGTKIADAVFGVPYRGGFGAKMRSVRFTLGGVTFTGRYGCDWASAVRVRSTKKIQRG